MLMHHISKLDSEETIVAKCGGAINPGYVVFYYIPWIMGYEEGWSRKQSSWIVMMFWHQSIQWWGCSDIIRGFWRTFQMHYEGRLGSLYWEKEGSQERQTGSLYWIGNWKHHIKDLVTSMCRWLKSKDISLVWFRKFLVIRLRKMTPALNMKLQDTSTEEHEYMKLYSEKAESKIILESNGAARQQKQGQELGGWGIPT